MNKLLKILTITLLLPLLVLIPLNAEEESEDEDDIRDVRGELDSIEEERTKEIEEQLLLDLPEITDNPNHIVTFRNPSEEESVYIEIDGDDFKEIGSPYNLPSLSLGRHNLTFKFHDEDNTERKIERNITVIPRPPKIKPPEVTQEGAKISGTALSNSQVELFITRDTYNEKTTIKVDHQGLWEKKFTENIEEGTYTIVGITRSRGYTSEYSNPLVFKVDRTETEEKVEKEEKEEIVFSLDKIDPTDIQGTINTISSNRDFAITLLSTLLGGLILGIILVSIINKIIQKKSKKVFKELLTKKSKDEKKTSYTQKSKLKNLKSQNKDFEAEEEEDFEKQFMDEEDEAESLKDKFSELQNEEDEEEEEEGEDEDEDDEDEEKEDSKSKPKELKNKFKALKEKGGKSKKGMSSKAKNAEKSMALSREEFLEQYKEHKPKRKKQKKKKS